MTSDQPNSLPEKNLSGRIAAVDYGTVRIGLAVTDPEQRLSSPYESYTRRSPQSDADHFRRLARDEAIAKFVVGLPVHLSGRESGKSIEARRFAVWLGEITQVPVELFDERFTSYEAEQLLIAADVSRRGRRRRIDKLAAHILLLAYLEARPLGPTEPLGLDD